MAGGFVWNFVYLIVGMLLVTGWFAQSVNARLADLTYLPQFVKFMSAALVYLAGMFVHRRRLPIGSTRLFHASFTLAVMTYFVPSFLLFHAARILPTAPLAIMMGVVPMFAVFVLFPEGKSRAPLICIALAGMIAMFLALKPYAAVNGNYFYGCLMVFIAVAIYVFSLWIFKRVFWIHSSPDLNFWAMFFASLGFLFFAIAQKEYQGFTNPGAIYWGAAVYSGALSTGLGIYLFTNTAYRQGVLGNCVMTAVLALGPTALGIALWHDFPLNPIAIGGAVVLGIATVVTAATIRPHRWLLHYPHSGVRQGERLLCLMDGVLRFQNGEERKIQILDISIGGLGIRSDREIKEGDEPMLFLPVSYNQSTLHVQCKVVRSYRTDSLEFPYSGGMIFQNLNLDRRQSIIEFIAKLSVTEEP